MPAMHYTNHHCVTDVLSVVKRSPFFLLSLMLLHFPQRVDTTTIIITDPLCFSSFTGAQFTTTTTITTSGATHDNDDKVLQLSVCLSV